MRELIAVLLFMLAFTGMLILGTYATRPVTAVELEHQRDVANAQTTIDGLTDRINRYDDIIERSLDKLEDVRERATALDGTIDQLTDLFEQYDGAVDEMVREFRALQNATTFDD